MSERCPTCDSPIPSHWPGFGRATTRGDDAATEEHRRLEALEEVARAARALLPGNANLGWLRQDDALVDDLISALALLPEADRG